MIQLDPYNFSGKTLVDKQQVKIYQERFAPDCTANRMVLAPGASFDFVAKSGSMMVIQGTGQVKTDDSEGFGAVSPGMTYGMVRDSAVTVQNTNVMDLILFFVQVN